MKQPYFTTADGVAVGPYSTVYCISDTVIESNDEDYYVLPEVCINARLMVDKEHIFSTRAAAQAECDKLNQR